jgi:hypothetical protein
MAIPDTLDLGLPDDKPTKAFFEFLEKATKE